MTGVPAQWWATGARNQFVIVEWNGHGWDAREFAPV